MSIRRQDLERSSKKLVSNLEQLQRENVEQELQIDSTLSQLQQQQRSNEQLLQSDWSHSLVNQAEPGALQRPVQREMSFATQVKKWSTADVIRWLETRKLHKFILLFQRHHVEGADLVDLKMPFLEDYDHISVEDRELLLAEVYELLKLECPAQDDEERIKTSVDRQKYQAAIQLTKDRSDLFHRSQSVPVVLTSLQQASSSPSSPSSTTSSPTPKLRKKTESDSNWSTMPRQKSPGISSIDNSGLGNTGTLPKPKRQNKALEKRSPSLFKLLDGKGSQEMCCVRLRKDQGTTGVSFVTDSRGYIVLHDITTETQRRLPVVRSGDRVIEANGVTVMDEEHLNQIEGAVQEGSELQLVVCCDASLRRLERRGSRELADQRWWTFHKLLTDLKNQDIDPQDIISNIPQNNLNELKDRCKLQDELLELKAKLEEKDTRIEQLQREVTNKDDKMWEMKRQRDTAVKVSDRLNSNGKHGATSQGESEYYKITMDSLKLDTASKDEVVSSLKEIVKEASRQKFYLDRLISVVIEESPWILEEVDADFDDVSQSNTSEEFC